MLNGTSGGGDVIASGAVYLRGLKGLDSLNLDIQTRSVSLAIFPNVVGVATGKVNLRLDANQQVSVTGKATIEEALVTTEFGNASVYGHMT